MKYCYECGTKLTEKFLENEGMIPYCETCQEFRFPIFSTAVSMEIFNPEKDKVLLIQQYGKKRNILVAGYVNKGESAEHAMVREVMEEVLCEADQLSKPVVAVFLGADEKFRRNKNDNYRKC